MVIDSTRCGKVIVRYTDSENFVITKSYSLNKDFALEQNENFVTIAYSGGILQVPSRRLIELGIEYADTGIKSQTESQGDSDKV